MDDFEARRAEVLADELAGDGLPPGWLWWLSFVDPARAAPEGEQVAGGPGFLGVVVVDAPGPVWAVTVASALGANPGGEVAMFPCPVADVPPEYRDRLLSPSELKALGWL